MSIFFSFLLILVIIAAITDTSTAQTIYDDCRSETKPCLNGGRCTNDQDDITYALSCFCEDGFTGHYCESEIVCDYCLNGGECTGYHGIFKDKCRCSPGFTGTFCETTEEMAKQNELNEIVNQREKVLKIFEQKIFEQTSNSETRQEYEQYFKEIDVEIANRRLELGRMKARNARLQAENMKAEEMARQKALENLINDKKGALRFLNVEAKDDKTRQEVKEDIKMIDASIAKLERASESYKARIAVLEKELMKSG